MKSVQQLFELADVVAALSTAIVPPRVQRGEQLIGIISRNVYPTCDVLAVGHL